MNNFRYSKLPLAGKILLPVLTVFLSLWTVGTLSVGYLETRKQTQALTRETHNAAFQATRELDTTQQLLSFKAKSIIDIDAVSSAVSTQNTRALLRTLLPLRASLDLDLVKILTPEGTVLSDLRSSAVSSTNLQDAEIITLAERGLFVTSIIVPDDSDPMLVRTIAIQHQQETVGSILVGQALTPDALSAMLGNQQKQVVLLQNSAVITATLPISHPIDPTELIAAEPQDAPLLAGDTLSGHSPQPLRVEGADYLAQPIELPQIAGDQFQAVVLTPLATLQASQRQMWLIVVSFGSLGAVLVSTVGIWVTHLITRRITTMKEATQKLADGDLTVCIPVEGHDEVAALATSFNHMTEQLKHRNTKIETQVAELERLLSALHQMPEQVHAEKMAGLSQMVAGIAHEINNPVSFIYSNVQPATDYILDLLHLLNLYQQTFPSPPKEITEAEETLDVDFIAQDLPNLLASMKSGASRIREVVLSFRNFSRKDESAMKTVDIHEGLDNTIVTLAHRLSQKNEHGESPTSINVVKAYGELPDVCCFPKEINQVFTHILSNAIDFLETDGDETPRSHPQIQIQTSTNTHLGICIRIEDNGPGIPKALLSKLFDPFFTTKPVGQGMGLGLSICYQIVVNKHGGKIWCESEPGQGTAFIIQLPIAQPEHSPVVQTVSEAA